VKIQEQRPYNMFSENKNLFIAIVDHAGTSSSPPYPLFLGKRLELEGHLGKLSIPL